MRLILVAVLLSGVAWGQQGTPAGIAASDYQAACMDVAEIETRGTQPMGPVLAQIAALQSNRQLAGVLAALERVGIGALFPTGRAGEGTLPVRTSAYRDYIDRLLTLLGDAPPQAAEEAEAAIQIGVGLSRARQPETEGAKPGRLSLADLQRLAPNVNWRAYFDALGVPSSAGVQASASYVQAVNGMVLITPLERWKSYLRARWLDASAPLLSPPFVAAHDSFYRRPAAASRSERCQRQQRQFTPQELTSAAITRIDYFADTMRLRAVRFAVDQSREMP